VLWMERGGGGGFCHHSSLLKYSFVVPTSGI
jgi:hypothetical protein